MKALRTAMAFGARTKAGELARPRKASSLWKASDMCCPTMIVARREPASDPLGKAAKAAAHALADRLERLEAGRPACGMDAHALG